MTSSTWRHYLTWMLATMLATVGLCGAFNAFIDPLGIFGAPRITGLNATKPYLDHHRDLARWQAAHRVCPSAGIFGNSRAEIGFDPEHPAFSELGLVAFNHAIPGTSINTALRQLRWLQEAGCPPQVIVLGVEFFDFLGAPAAKSQAPSLSPAPHIDANVIAETVFSITALRDSVTTIAAQYSRYPATLTPRGFNPLLTYIPEVEHNGHYALFRQRAVENLKTWSRKSRHIQPGGSGRSVELAGLEAFLDTAAQSSSRVHLVIYPYHAQLRLMMERAGLGPLFTDWKALMMDTVDRTHPTPGNVKLWDFSGLDEATMEPIPAPNDRKTHLTYYWEAGHFKKALGDQILNQILLDRPGFGVLLQPASFNAQQEEDQRRTRDALAQPSSLLREVDSLFNPPGRAHPPR